MRKNLKSWIEARAPQPQNVTYMRLTVSITIRNTHRSLQRFSCELTLVHLSPIQNIGPPHGQNFKKGLWPYAPWAKHSFFTFCSHSKLQIRVKSFPQFFRPLTFQTMVKHSVDSHENRCVYTQNSCCMALSRIKNFGMISRGCANPLWKFRIWFTYCTNRRR